MSFHINALPGHCAALVVDWVFQQAATADDVQQLKDALGQYGVLVFRGQGALSDTELINFARPFGPLIEGSHFFGDAQAHPEILRVNNLRDKQGQPLGTGGAEACDWHSDYAYLPQVGLVSFLNAQIVPAKGGRTYFANTDAGLCALDAPERALLKNTRAYHDTLAADRNIRVEEAREKSAQKGAAPSKPSALHPTLITHPFNGKETLYINPMLTRYIDGLPAKQSHQILEKCFKAISAPENVYAHDWQIDDLVVWDNISMIHRRDSFDPHATRSMRQLTALLSS